MCEYKDCRKITAEMITNYNFYLQEQEKGEATIQKYIHDLKALYQYLNGEAVTKMRLLSWKKKLIEDYAPTSVNTMLAGINGLMTFCGWNDLKMKPLKIQRHLFCQEEKELTKAEYFCLVKTAKRKKNERLALIIQTICATGIRVSKLQYITAEAVYCGKAIVRCKGKVRNIFLPNKLREILIRYMKEKTIHRFLVYNKYR